jgi:hypothetical protein
VKSRCFANQVPEQKRIFTLTKLLPEQMLASPLWGGPFPAHRFSSSPSQGMGFKEPPDSGMSPRRSPGVGNRSGSEEETNETYKIHECLYSGGIRSRFLSAYWLRWRINGRVTQGYLVSDQFDLR